MALVVITGAAGALGSAVARHLVASGSKVAGVDISRSQARLTTLQTELGAAFSPHTLDASGSMASVLENVEKIEPVAGAVLTAGGWTGGPLSAESWESMMRLNAESAQQAMTALLPGMVSRKRGSIVLIGSRAAVHPETSAGAAAYAASKAAVVALAQALAAEVRDSGVRINAVLPSTIDTEANRRAMPDADPTKWVSPQSLAEVIGFLLSDASRDVSGAALPVYGRS